MERLLAHGARPADVGQTGTGRSPAPLQVVEEARETLLRAGIRTRRRGDSALTVRPVILQRASRRMVLAAHLQPLINVETLYRSEIKHAYEVFSFRRMQSFHDKWRPMRGAPASVKRQPLNRHVQSKERKPR